MKKLLLSTLLGLFLMTGIALTAFASTSSSLDESNYIYSMKNGYGAEFSPPVLQASDDHGVNPSSGYVSVKENLLSLPGKNGFDFNLNLSYVNSTRSKSVQELYNVRVVDAMAFKLLKYDYYQNGVKKSIWGRYRAESDVQETVYASYSQLSSLQSDSSENISPAGRKYFVFSELKEGDVELTLDRSQPAVSEAFPVSTMIEYTAVVNGNTNKTWKVNVPGLEVGQYSLPTRQGSGSFIDETGAVYPYTINIQYGFDPETGVTINSLHKVMSVDIVGSGNREYKTIDTADFGEKKQHALGFEYNTVLQSDAGTQYYFYIDYMGVGTLHAIVDKSGNAITVKKISDQGISYYEFVDSMNRMIRLYSNSVKLVENGQEKEIVRFEEGVEHNPDDPNHILKTDDTYTMKIYRRESEDGDITTTKNITQYNLILKEYDILNRSGNPMVSSPIEARLLDKIIYPTGATRHYEYAEAKSKYGEMVYRVSRAYSKDGETTLHDTTYSYTKDTEKEYPERYAPEYTTTVTVSGGGENVYTYDGYERLISFTNYMTEETETYSYCYSGKYTTDLAFSMRPLEQSYNDSGILTRYQYENGWPTRTEKTGEPIVLNTYDDRYMQVTRSEALRDNTHWVITENTLSEDGRYIVSSQVSEDDIVQSKTMYQYDSYGNIIEEKVTDSDGSVLSLTKYAYTYNSDGSSQVKSWAENVKDADGNTTAKIETISDYDIFGRLVSSTDARGNTTTYTYDLLGRVLSQTNSDGTDIEYVYDTKNNVITITNENGNQERHSYTPTGLYESVEVKQNGTWKPVYEYSYDEHGRKVGETEYRSGSEHYTAAYSLDNRDRITVQSIKNASEETVSLTNFSYDTEEGTDTSLLDISLAESEGTVSDDPNYVGIITRPMNKDFAMAKYEIGGTYDYFDVTVRGDDEYSPFVIYGDGELLFSGTATKRTQDCTINVTGIQELTLQSEDKIYWRMPTLYTGPMLVHKTTISPQVTNGSQDKPEIVQYSDLMGQIWRETVSNARTNELISETENRYDRSGNLLTTTTGEQTTSYEYNYQNQAVKVTNPEGNSQITEYDALGRTVAQTDFLGNTTEIEYDTLGRQIILRAPFNGETKAVTKNYYDANGNVTKTLVQDNAPGAADSFKKTEYTYDGRNRLVSAAVYADDNTPNYTQYKYDNVGNTTAVYTGLSAPLNLATSQGADMDYAVTRYVYNELNQPVAMIDALGQTTTYEYDYAGNVTEMTDRNGTVTNVEYNLWGAPVTQSAAKDGTVQTITNTYDRLGLLRSTTDENGTTTYAYDAMGRLTEEEFGDTINSYSYDMYGNRTAYTLTRGGATLSATSYTYDSMNRLATMTNGGVTTSYTYDANGQVLTEQGGGYSTSYTYNDGGLLTAKTGTGAAGEVLDVSYSHALDGNILQKDDEDEGVTTYVYDGAGRLTDETNTAANVANSYSYDEYGNRTGAVLGGTAVSYTYDKNNRLTKESATAGGTTTDVLYQYDPNGNRVSVVTSSVTAEQAGTAGISLELPQLETALNRYDAFGRLVESEITKDGARTLAQYTYNASGYRTSKTVNGVTTEHVLDGANVAADVANGQVTQYVRGLGLTALVQADGTRLQYVTDGHGDVTKLISGSGTVVVDYTYDAFGNQTEEAEDSNPFRYAGEYWDSESGLIYLRARYYDSGVGVFVSEDPAKDGLNWYVYCSGNPVNFWDPTGKYKEGDEKYSQEAREGIDIYGQIWLDAEAAYSLGIISEGEKKSIQTTVEDAADAIRESEDHPWKTFGRNVLEFALFDVVLGDFSHTTVYAADLSGLAFDKMYNNESNFSAIVAVAGVASYNKGRTLVNTKINGKMTRVDIEFPQGNKPGNLHVQIKGTDTKVMINSLDDIGNLPKSVRNNTKVINAIKKGLKLLQKLI